MVNHYEDWVNNLGIQYLLPENITVFVINFIKHSLNLWMFSSHSKPFTGTFWDIAHPYKLFASKYISYDDSMLLSWFFIYPLFALVYLCIAWHIPPRMPFSTINNKSILVNNSNSTSVLFKQACHANPSTEKNE